MPLSEIENLREDWDFEAKAAQGQHGRGELPNSFWETLSAMANTSGGQIVLGLKEQADGSMQVLGLADPDKVERDLWSLQGDRRKISAAVLDRRHVRQMVVDHKTLLVIEVPRASRVLRPVYLGPDPFAGTYIRMHEGDHHAERPRVARMLADADTDRPADSVVQQGFGLADLHEETIRQYRHLLSARVPDHAFLREDTLGLLRSIRAWGRDREGGYEGPTLAGLLMFGKEAAICSHLPRFFLEYQRQPAIPTPARRWEDRLTPDGTWNANLLEFYWRVYPRLVDGLQVPFALGPGSVRQGETAVHDALREALVNCLIHASHGDQHGVKIIRRPDGYEFTNPGIMLVDHASALQGGVSQCRNPSIQHQFVLVGLGERAGSGLPTIVQAWDGQHWRKPLLEEDASAGITRLRLTTASLLPPDVLQALTVRFPHFPSMDEVARLALVTAQLEGEVSNRRLQDVTGRSGHDLTVVLQGLVASRCLVKDGRTTGTTYTLTSLPVGPANSQNNGASSQNNGANSQISGGNSQNSDSGLSGIQAMVQAVAGQQRAKPGKVRQAILALCTGRYMSTAELARHLARQQATIQQSYVQPMVDEGLLEPREPSRHSPNQAYRTRAAESAPGPAAGEVTG